MVSILGIVIVGVMVAVQTAIAALLTRMFRVRLESQWGPVVFALVILPVVLTLTTLVMGRVGPDIGSRGTVVFVLIAAPVALGLTIDYVWMPAPEKVDLPDTMQ